MSEFETWVALIGTGRQVRVTLDREDPRAVIVGELVGLSEDGQGTVIPEDGIRHYVWPVLAVEEL
jgi:hypothetical protein